MKTNKIPYTERLLRAMHARGGEINRRTIIVDLFHRNWSRARIDALLTDPRLAGLIETSRGPMRGARRLSTRIRLTVQGWGAANRLVNQAPALLNHEEVRRQFEMLVTAGNPWATGLLRDAAYGRQRQDQERRKEEERRAARQKELDAMPAHPSKGHKRSARDQAKRAAWARSKGFVPRYAEGLTPGTESVTPAPNRPRPVIAPAPAPAIPVAPVVVPAIKPPAPAKRELTPDEQARKDFLDAIGLSRMYSPPASHIPQDCEPLRPLDAKEKAKSESLAERIRQKGYQVRDGKILYGGSWISPDEWRAKTPHVEL